MNVAQKRKTAPSADARRKQPRVAKNCATTPAAVPAQHLLSDEAERTLSLRIYGSAACHFDAPCFAVLHEEEVMTIMKTENPEVCESGLECRRCRSNRIYSRSMQVRGGDEGTTVFAICSECNYSWREG